IIKDLKNCCLMNEEMNIEQYRAALEADCKSLIELIPGTESGSLTLDEIQPSGKVGHSIMMFKDSSKYGEPFLNITWWKGGKEIYPYDSVGLDQNNRAFYVVRNGKKEYVRSMVKPSQQLHE